MLVTTVDTDNVILIEPLFCLLRTQDILLDLAQNFGIESLSHIYV